MRRSRSAEKSGHELPHSANSAARRRAPGCIKPLVFRAKMHASAHGTGLCDIVPGTKASGISPVSLNGITASALSARFKTNSAALGVVSNNVTNINTPGYARRVVNEQTLVRRRPADGRGYRQRAARRRPVPAAGNALGQRQRLRNMTPWRACSPSSTACWARPATTSRWPPASPICPSAFATASQAPSSSSSYTAILNALQGVASDITNVSGTISSLQSQIDGQVVSSISSTNALIKQVYRPQPADQDRHRRGRHRPRRCSTSATWR